MGNLYTRPIFNYSYHIELLFELKKEYGKKPKNFGKIKLLKQKLARWEAKQLLKQPPQKKHYNSVFNNSKLPNRQTHGVTPATTGV